MRPSEQLLAGRRALDRVPAIEIIEDWTSFGHQWALRIRISISVSSALVPALSDWYLLADEDYPQGRILMLPAKTNSIQETFQHQRYNAEGPLSLPWRLGNICLSTNELRSGSLISPVEPWDARDRLRWSAERGIAWLTDAAMDKLAVPGQPFELPDFPSTDKFGIIGYNEDVNSLNVSNRAEPLFGTGKLLRPSFNQKLVFLTELSDIHGSQVKTFDWGSAAIAGRSEAICWFRLSAPPFFQPWRSPNTFGELQKVCAIDGVDFYRAVRSAFMRLGCPNSFFAVVGFPIPETISGPAAQMHWQPFRISGLEKKKGVRDQPEHQWNIHCRTTIGPKQTIQWLASENWAKTQLRSRGSLPASVKKKMLLIGAGAVGSVVAENFARGGIENITIIDPQELAIGNLVRHTLDMSSVGANKAEELAQRLNLIGPHIAAKSIAQRFGITNETEKLVAEEYDLIIDCSATDQVPLALSKLKFKKLTRFASFSITQGADKMLLFCSEGTSFDSQKFYELMNPILDSEIKRLVNEPLPREGIGCWHPVFPGAYHDISALTGFALKRLGAIASSPWKTQLQVFSNTADGINLFWFAGEKPHDV